MLHFICAGLLVLRLVFAGDFARLDSPRFDERRAATKRLYDAWPLSAEAAQRFADTTDSVEARIRAEHVNENRIAKLYYRATPEIWDAVVAAIVADTHEGELGLPWEADWHGCWFEGHEGFNEAIIRLVDRGIVEGWLTEEHRYIGTVREGWPEDVCPGYATGISDLRFRFRGLPTIGEYLTLTNWHGRSHESLAAIWRLKKHAMTMAGFPVR